MIEYSSKIKEEMKAIQSEIFENILRKIYREPTVKGRKPGLRSMIWSRKKK